MPILSDKQKEFWRECHHRWNVKAGATRSGKTYMDYFIIPRRIMNTKGQGLIVILGNTQATIERNILEPMRNMYGSSLVGNVRLNNECMLFGKKAYIIGADNKGQVERIQGSGIEYCYGDEVTTWSEEVFQMLKSRLSCENSVFDGTCNPDSPYHWFKKFLDSGSDIYEQSYTIDDNPFLPADFVKNLKQEYNGTIYYNRYILGQWCLAEGLLFPQFANNSKKWIVSEDYLGELFSDEFNQWKINIGLDVGGTKSHSTLIATAISPNYNRIITLEEMKVSHSKGTVEPEDLYSAYDSMQSILFNKYRKYAIYLFVDSEAQVIENGLRNHSRSRYNTVVSDCKKMEMNNRINAYTVLLGSHKMQISENCPMVIESLSTMVYDKNEKLLDDYSTDVDTYDGHFYSWSQFTNYLIR